MQTTTQATPTLHARPPNALPPLFHRYHSPYPQHILDVSGHRAYHVQALPYPSLCIYAPSRVSDHLAKNTKSKQLAIACSSFSIAYGLSLIHI